MQEYEIRDILDNIAYTDRNIWESGRFQAYVTAQVNSKKRINPKDVMKFRWESEQSEETGITNQEIERMKKRSQSILKAIKNNTNG